MTRVARSGIKVGTRESCSGCLQRNVLRVVELPAYHGDLAVQLQMRACGRRARLSQPSLDADYPVGALTAYNP